MQSNKIIITDDIILTKIYLVRGQKVMLDRDLAELYGVETKKFNQAVKRNKNRFPEDFSFKLTEEEFENLRSQFVTSSWGGTRYFPMAFTEQGVAMLSSVLNSEIAINVNIQIIRIFTRMREMLQTHKDILMKLEELQRNDREQRGTLQEHDERFQQIFECLNQLLNPPNPPRRAIGFNAKD